MSSLTRRRSVVAVSVVAALFVAAFTIRLAASFTAGSAPLTDRPVDANQVMAQLQDEQARAAALADQLAQVNAQSSELRDALKAAEDKATSDSATAEDLATQLEAARAKLAALEAQLAAASTTTVTVTNAAPASTTSTSSGGEYEDEHDGEHEGDD
jgi:septal ring factor EnvC (AmiA/AmiB activator)